MTPELREHLNEVHSYAEEKWDEGHRHGFMFGFLLGAVFAFVMSAIIAAWTGLVR